MKSLSRSLPSGETLREIIRLCRDSKVRFLTIPGMRSLIEGDLQILQLRAISVEDLLRRAPAEINLAEIAAYITGKKILITGAGGSIGSEICRQVLPFKPAAIILLGHGENSIFTVLQELMIHPEVGNIKLIPVIASIKDEERIDYVFSTYKPDIVFHAAAHKHVPLLEHAQTCNTQKIISTFAQIVVSYHPSRDQHNYEPRKEEPLAAISTKGRTHLKVL